jgi:hypothetical protein
MRVRFAWKRTFLAAAIFMGAVVGVSRSFESHLIQPLTIEGHFKGSTVLVTATKRSAGAIESLQWGGTEFLDANDHGRDLQSAVSFDGLTECDNPTEAGSSRDGAGAFSSSSRLEAASIAGNVLRTHSHMAYWLRHGHHSAACKEALNDGDRSPVSSTRLTKAVRFLPGFDNVLEHRIAFDLARPRATAQFEVLTAYMPKRFGTFYRFNPAADRLEALSDGPGEQELPVVLATADGSHALGLFTPQTAKPDLAGPGYGRWRFGHARVTKSNVVFRLANAAAGPHRFLVYTVFGSVDDVRTSLARLYRERDTIVAERLAEGPVEADFDGPKVAMDSAR